MKISFFQTILFKKCFQLHIVIVITKKKIAEYLFKNKNIFRNSKKLLRTLSIKFM